jgi:hypothetical protein
MENAEEMYTLVYNKFQRVRKGKNWMSKHIVIKKELNDFRDECLV